MKCEPNVKELMTEQKGELLFFQLPDHLPNRKEEKSSGKKADVNAKQILQEFPEGYLGKLQIRKSGIYLVMDFFLICCNLHNCFYFPIFPSFVLCFFLSTSLSRCF